MTAALTIRVDDLSGEPTRALIAHHLAGMHALTPAESVHALGLEALRHPDITVWSAWAGDDIAGVGALKRFGDAHGEIKSMRVADTHLGTGVGRALVRHIVAEARAAGIRALWLETGADAGFQTARGLYASEGFEVCGPFGSYRLDPLSTFMTRAL
ncbi:GNAT family N-acetyltransferase [Microbacterium dauci]|uniref:GNAT family N-acetyltransferase n=1 Tax=Microbacterium dauci TaxID=3048008 RepID=A0ABT6ZGU2_9MICO|nr:GNAT family N-acetyltransferase [Microbacterium sp. LX3-4]MDJ1114975.1 GNAT family N-acetyltransferase [Microbacterium sp. LX3-4]